MGRIIGIDLGTTNSCVAVLEGGEPFVIHNQEGGRTTPSMVSWNADGDVVVGAASKRQMITNPGRTVFGVKRLMGRRIGDPELERIARTLPYQVVAAKNGDAWVSIDGASRSPQEISAHVVAKMRRVAEDYLGDAVTEAVITVPAYFDDVQRQATKDAGAIAGLQVRAILNEPTAAALAYGIHHQHDQRVAVFDLGGGTFDISILTIENGVFEVLATSGDTMLGGDDFDRIIIELLAEEFRVQHGVELRNDAVALQRLKEAAEQAKIELSSTMATDINLPFIAVGPGGPQHLTRSLSRGELERACKDLLARLGPPCVKALELARCTAADIDQVLLVGGMTRMPAVQEAVVGIFGRPAHKGVNPDESVAAGAAVHSAVIGGELQEVVLLDVTPHDLGVKVTGDKMSVIIPANTSIPTREKKIFATTEDNQTFVAVEVHQGGHEQASKNRRLGRFVLGDLRPAPRGVTRVEVSFTMDADGILHVDAVEVATGKATSVKIEAGSGLSGDEIKRLAAGMR
ncbi:MAG: molecular chaperone DnaK [Kofleriaceae bacterium]|jgi:molecular chaperone DnaK|nr:molecular chaperone DnaK [Kofleriaceae bacterium]MBP9169015.1 molecular chaperone DnaK [Kofleriaceae bacterium]MBP9858868.1 molecular chaperone DnaK [Kofleriaceae bacterium]